MSALDDVIRYHSDNCQSGTECDLSALSRAELAQLRSRAEAAEARAADLAEANREQSETIDILRAELAQLRSSFVTLKARCDELTEMAIGRDAEIERLHIELEATAAAYKIGNDELKRIIETLRTERNEAWSSLKDARDTIQDLTL